MNDFDFDDGLFGPLLDAQPRPQWRKAAAAIRWPSFDYDALGDPIAPPCLPLSVPIGELRWFTTVEAAAYLRFKGPSSTRAVVALEPVGQ